MRGNAGTESGTVGNENEQEIENDFEGAIEEGRQLSGGLRPSVVEADANAFLGGAVLSDLVAEPAFKKDDVARLGRVGGCLLYTSDAADE